MKTSNKISLLTSKRIPLLFLLGIGIPGILLGYLAFRGIQNDQALLEKERLNEHRIVAELITRTIEENIAKAEQAFFHTIALHPEPSQPALFRSLDSLKNQKPLIEEIFLFEDFEKIDLPVSRLLFLPNGNIESYITSTLTSTLAKKLKTGQQFEFQQKSYRKALTSYQQAYEQVSDRQIKGELLSAIARVQKKSFLFQDAIKTYETISQEYSHEQTPGGVSLVLAARIELGSLFLAINDTSGAVKAFIELYEDLVHREWRLEEGQFDFFAQNIKGSVDEIFSKVSLASPLQPYQRAFAGLQDEEIRQRKITERLLTFQGNASEDLRENASRVLEDSRSSLRRMTLERGGQIYLISLSSQYPGNGKEVSGIWGILLNADYIRNNILLPAVQRHIYSEKTGWVVKGRDGTVILKSENPPSGSITLRTSFEGNFPPWSVEFYQPDPYLFETLVTSRRGIYFYMFLLIAGILIFGSILTIRAVTHELELAKMKSDFVSTISHEFKSPLTSIRQLSEMLQAGRVPSDERHRRYYDVLVEQSERLSLLIDNILDFAKIEEGRKEFKFEKVDISMLMEEIVSLFQHRVRHEDFVIEVKIEKPLPLTKIDSAAITQAVANILDNAIKYSGETKKVFVTVFAEKQNLVIAVQDFGIGIRKEEIDKVFERFYRGGDDLTRLVKGSGIGLALVKQIVEAHHGNVQVESEPGRGSTFSLWLPL